MIMDTLLGFNCPLCNSNHAHHVSVKRANGESYRTEFYECAGCSVMFRDLERFSKLVRSIYDPKLSRVESKEMRSDYP